MTGPARDPLLDALAALARVMVGVTVRTLAGLDVDLTTAQHRIIVLLAGGPRRTVDLAEALGVHPSTASRNCERLVRRGLVRRYRLAPDLRVSWLVLTEHGRDLVGEVMRRRTAELGRLLDATPEARDPADGLVAALDALVRTAGEPTEPQWWEQWAAATEAPGQPPA